MKRLFAVLVASLLAGCATYTIVPSQQAMAAPQQTVTVTCPLGASPAWNGARWVCTAPAPMYGYYPYYGYAPYYAPNWGVYLHFGRRR